MILLIVRFRVHPKAGCKTRRNSFPLNCGKVSCPHIVWFDSLPRPSLPTSNDILPRSRGDARNEAEQAAWVAVDRALATAKDDANAGANDAKKVFSELEGADKAISAACSSVIACLLQVWATLVRSLFLARGSRASCIFLMLLLPESDGVSVFSGKLLCRCLPVCVYVIQYPCDGGYSCTTVAVKAPPDPRSRLLLLPLLLWEAGHCRCPR